MKKMKDFKSIIVKRKRGQEVAVVENPTPYPLIGKGYQGAVFKLSDNRCVKVYARKKDVQRESKALAALQDSLIVPKLYEVGTNYIVMEYIDGTSLRYFLKAAGSLPEHITKQLLLIIKEMERAKFTQKDASLRHVIVTKEGDLKIIDLVHAYAKSQNHQPKRLFKGLRSLGLLTTFLEQVKEIDL
jgi:RIO-like serine/threonine protein kinase